MPQPISSPKSASVPLKHTASPSKRPAAGLSGRATQFFLIVLAMGLFVSSSAARGAEFPWKKDAPPPPVGGIRVGDTREQVESVLGKPDDVVPSDNGTVSLEYYERGLTVLLDPKIGVAFIYLVSKSAGDIGEVRLGDTKESVVARWGDPHAVTGNNFMYRTDNWMVVMGTGSDGKLDTLYIGVRKR